MTTEQMQEIIDENNSGEIPIWVIDEDNITTIVDDDEVTFNRHDGYGGRPLSGWATYGMVGGDHRMIRAIYDDMQTAFSLIKLD